MLMLNAAVRLHSYVLNCYRLDYCNAVLYGAAKQRLQTVMNAAARLVGGLGKYDHVTPVLRNTLHWLPIQQRTEFKVAVLAFDCVRGTYPSYCCGICTPLTEVGGRVRLRSAHRGDLCVPSTRKFGKRSFRVAASRTWKELFTATSPFANYQPTTVPVWAQYSSLQTRLHMTFTSENY